MSKPHIYMTDSEIRTRWNRRALSDRQMVKCLSELNGVEMAVMVEKMLDLGLIDTNVFNRYRECASWTEQELHVVEYMVAHNSSVKAIQERLGRSLRSVTQKVREVRERRTCNG